MQPKVATSTHNNNHNNGEVAKDKDKDKEYSSRISGALSNSIISITDLFKDGNKSVKFPKDLLKVLESRLQSIAMGRDPAYVQLVISPSNSFDFTSRYSDQLVRRTMAVFYGQIKDESFRKQMKENRKVEELILMFVTNATGALKKDPSLPADGWKVELNNHIALFVMLLRDCVKTFSHVSPELTQRLDMYASKLAPSQSQTPNDSGYDSASTSRDRRDSVSVSTKSSRSVSEMSMVRCVAKLFQIPEHAIQGEIDQMSKSCTEKVPFSLHIS
jgi:hypothetical protein